MRREDEEKVPIQTMRKQRKRRKEEEEKVPTQAVRRKIRKRMRVTMQPKMELGGRVRGG